MRVVLTLSASAIALPPSSPIWLAVNIGWDIDDDDWLWEKWKCNYLFLDLHRISLIFVKLIPMIRNEKIAKCEHKNK